MTDMATANSDAAGGGPSKAVGTLASISVDCPDPSVLADFYARLLGMRRVFEAADGSVIALSDGTAFVTMMRTEGYVPPTWPHPGQLQQLHLDISVTELTDSVARAVELGAREADSQPEPNLWRVLIDPAGHPFCLTTMTGAVSDG